MNLEEAIEYACEHLPEGWSIRLDMEYGAGGVTMLDPECNTYYPQYIDDPIPDHICQLTRLAVISTPP